MMQEFRHILFRRQDISVRWRCRPCFPCFVFWDGLRQDIPLTAVLRSPIAGLSDEELAKLRLKDKDARFYECTLEECERSKQETEENPGQGR